MINLDNNPNLDKSRAMTEYELLEIERTYNYLPNRISVIAEIKKDGFCDRMNFICFPYENKNDRVNWKDIFTTNFNTDYAKRNILKCNDKQQTLNLKMEYIPQNLKYLGKRVGNPR